MNSDERNRFQSIDALRQAAYNSFNDRRSYEWKLSLALWTALAVLLVGLVQPAKEGASFPLQGKAVVISAGIVAIAIVVLHIYWSNGAARANTIDKAISLHFSQIMQDELNLRLDDVLQTKIAALPKTEGWRQWSHLAQVAITAVLALAAVAIIWMRAL